MFGLDRLVDFVTGIELGLAVFWLGLALFTIGLAVLLYTRWGQYRPLRKCMALSLLAHLLLATYAATIQIVTPRLPPPEPVIHVSLDGSDQPWESLAGEALTPPKAPKLGPSKPEKGVDPKHVAQAEPPRGIVVSEAKPLVAKSVPKVSASGSPHSATKTLPKPHERSATESSGPAAPSPMDVPLAKLGRPEALPQTSEGARHEMDAAPRASESPSSVIVVKPSAPIGSNANASAGDKRPSKLVSVSPAHSCPGQAGVAGTTLPNAYRLRVVPNKTSVARSHGGTAGTEAAVKTALKWLADNQAADGRWDPRAHDAGRETNVLGRARQAAGSRADSAVTGLALLAFLASGHTHLDGPYSDDIRRALEYLMRVQASDGNLAGEAATFEFMYSHAIATCAMSEAFGMTHDSRLGEPVRRAIGYSIAAQDPIGGGWRYRPGDPGDTSQLGWQLMSLKSAELAGIPIPETTRQGVIRYLRSVSSGRYGGRASYRPGEPASRSMSAEALVCWQFLGLPREHPACDEAGEYLLGELPGMGQNNVYYWYYATLAMYQLQGTHWQRWNEALRASMISRQVKDGSLAGSWNTDDLWGGYGGRVYTTALSALTLEVYYRFLPLYGAVK